MKILQINTVISYGSTGIICQNIAQGLIANGHDCLTVYGRGNDVEDIPTKKIRNKFEQGLHYLRSHFLDQHGLGSCPPIFYGKCLANHIKLVISFW